ncbi:hypothetical protein A2300_03540 [Candidatus Falkowbacteria bacterium RIFOXYB2_FULL_35_7]|nr:MAG: hypothetical protein A2300_03540 [Candidatus Falkowbacteria bacterium RIFOXYB2_FULL_35_7]
MVFLPYLYALIFAAMLVVIFDPLYQKMLKFRVCKKFPSLTSFIVVLLVLLIILIPLVSLGFLMVKEATQLYSTVISGQTSYSLIAKIEESIHSYFPTLNIDLVSDFADYSKQALNFLITNLGQIFSNVAGAVFSFFIMLFALYYFLKDGHKLKQRLIVFSPLNDKYDKRIFEKLWLAVNSVIRGTLLVALIQGLLAGLGFLIFGVPNPVLLGAITIIAALVPVGGTAVVVIPAILYLFLTGQFFAGFGMLIWGFFLVGMIDNFLRPKLLEKDIKLHPFLIFISALGGIAVFGVFGFILGPLILSLLFALLDIYQEEFHQYIVKSR